MRVRIRLRLGARWQVQPHRVQPLSGLAGLTLKLGAWTAALLSLWLWAAQAGLARPVKIPLPLLNTWQAWAALAVLLGVLSRRFLRASSLTRTRTATAGTRQTGEAAD